MKIKHKNLYARISLNKKIIIQLLYNILHIIIITYNYYIQLLYTFIINE